MSSSVNLTQYSLTIPDLSEPFVPRTNWVNWIHDRFSEKRQAILVQAPDGAGKTTLLAQFARTYADRCFCFFIKPDQYVATPRRFYQELCKQMEVVVSGKEKDYEGDYDFNELRQVFGDLYYRIGAKARRSREEFYFVIDGLEWTTEIYEQESILNLLPTHFYPQTYLLASSRPEQSFNFEYEAEECPLFSEIETAKYFELAGLKLDKDDTNVVFSVCQGMPGYLDQLRREIQDSDKDLDDIIRQLPKGFRELLERSWERLNITNSVHLKSLAVLVYSMAPLTLSTLASIMAVEEPELRDFVKSVPLLHSNERVSFVTDAHRQFVADKLLEYRAWVSSVLIDHYSKNLYDAQSLERLPVLLKESNRFDALKRLMSIDYLVRTLQEQQDMFLLHRNVQLIAEDAVERQDWQTLSKYTLISGILSTLSTEAILENELEALLALNDYEQSFKLAYQAVLTEDRLQFLARIGNRMIQQGETVPEAILSLLEQLVSQINPTDKLADRMTEVAADLFYVHPQAAIDLINKVIGGDTKGRSADFLLAMLTSKLEGEAVDHAETLRTRITDKKLQDFTRANSPVVAGLPADKVLAEVKKVEDTSSKLFQLRSWCNSNRDNPEAIAIIREALEIITAAEPHPSIRHLRQFAEPLVSSEGDEVFHLIERFDLLKDTALQNPAEEAIRLELLLATVEAKKATDDRAVIRLYQTFFDLHERILESDVRCYGLARMLLSLPEVKPDDSKLKRDLERHLRSEYENLLKVSADHESLTRRLLSPLANYNPRMAIEFAEKLNLAQTRDKAKSRIITVYADRKPDTIDFNFITKVIETITDQQLRDWTYVRVLERLTNTDARKLIPSSCISELRELLDKIADIANPVAATFAYAYAGKMHVSVDEKAARVFFEKMLDSQAKADQSWERAQLGFDLAALVADENRELAAQLIAQTRKTRLETPLVESVFAEIFINTLGLAIRSIPNIVKSESKAYQTSKQKLTSTIALIPSQYIQGLLFSQLAMRFEIAKKHDEFYRIVTENVLPILENLKDDKSRTQLLINISPCLFLYERSIMLEEISELSVPQRDQALISVLRYLLTGRPIGDPTDLDSLKSTVDYQRAIKFCDVLEYVSTDSSFYVYLEYLINSLIQTEVIKKGQKRQRCILQEKQALTVAKKLAKLIEKKLPDNNNIKHDGYKIAAHATLAQLRASVVEEPYRAHKSWQSIAPSWQEIAGDIRNKVPNLADQALVMTIVGEKMYWSDMGLAHQLLEEAERVINSIPNVVDRSNRLSILAEVWSEVQDESSAKLLLKEAMAVMEAWSWDATRDEVTGRILELAHKIDPEFATSLTSTIDNPLLRHDFEQDLVIKSLKQERKDVSSYEVQVDNEHYLYGEVTREWLSSLCSGKGRIRSHDFVSKHIHPLVGAKFGQVYNALAWSIENELQRTERLSTATLIDLYDGLLDSLELTLMLGKTLAGEGIEEYGYFHRDIPAPAGLQLFSVGTREEALAALRDWTTQNVHNYLKIYDPYFTQEDLSNLKHIPSHIRITILTSWKAQKGVSVGDIENLKLRYQDSWQTIADQNPPPMRIYIFGIKASDRSSSGDSPLHERYYVTSEGRGIKIGTSASGLGKKDTDFREMGQEETLKIEREFIDSTILYPPSHYKNEKLISSVLDL